MIPKNEKELEIYFKLKRLERAYNKRDEKIYTRSPSGEHEIMIGYNKECYELELKEYLDLVSQPTGA